MLRARIADLSALALAVCVCLLAVGCDRFGGIFPDEDDYSFVPLLPYNDTPRNTILRFESAYEYAVLLEYERLLTRDLRFHFSEQSDSALVALYGNDWDRDDEVESTFNLFQGSSNQHGDVLPWATAISMTLPNFVDRADSTHADSLDHYRVVDVPTLRLQIAFSDSSNVDVAAHHRYYLVRGDAAVLGAGQDAASNRWYIRRWDELSPTDTTSTSWGALKATYR